MKPFFSARKPRRVGRRWTGLACGLALWGLLSALAGGCATPEDKFYRTREANERVMLVFFLKDSECATAHVLTVPILAPAHRDEVDACIIGILDATCEDWAENDPTPDECRGLQVNLVI